MNFRVILCGAVLLAGLCGCSRRTAEPAVRKLKLNASVAGARAWVAGRAFQLPHQFKMSGGNYLFRLEKAGYGPAWFACRVSASGIETAKMAEGDTVRWEKLTVSEVVVPMREEGGTVLIESQPKAVEVSINGRVLGATPLILTNQPVGRHEAQLRCANYAENAVSWEIRDSRPVIVKADLRSNIGEIYVSSTPAGARLYIDEKLVGQTPYRSTIVIGQHQIRLEHDGYLPYAAHVSVTQGKKLRFPCTLTSSPGGLTVTSSPAGAQVTINGRVRGNTPLQLHDMQAGEYRLAISLQGFDRQEKTVKIVPGGKLTADFALKTSHGGIELNIYPAGVTVFLNNRRLGVVRPGEGSTQTQLMRIGNLAPGTYRIKLVHKRANPEQQVFSVNVNKGEISRPPRFELWVPNAEIVWRDNGKAELGMIYGESDRVVLFGPVKGIKYEIKKNLLKSIKWLDITE